MSNNTSESTTGPEWADNMLDYFSGAMAPEEAERFERRLLDCQENVATAQQYREVIGMLASTIAEPAEPPTGHKERFLARLQATPREEMDAGTALMPGAPQAPTRLSIIEGGAASRPEPARAPAAAAPATEERSAPIDLAAERRERRGGGIPLLVASIAAMLALFFGVWAMMLNNDRTNAENQAAQLQRDLAAAQGVVNIPPGYQVLAVQPQEPYTATAVAIFNPETQQAFLYSSSLEPLPDGKIYELWLLPSAGNPVPAGTFNAGAGGTTRHEHTASQPLRDYAGFAVTIEDAPGGPVPGGPIIMAGQYR
jgi:anti-sigma-K factor RskA